MSLMEIGETSSSQTLRRNPAVEEAPLHDELMLFNSTSSQFFVLNKTMAFTWKRLESTASLDQIASGMAESFAGVSIQTATADVAKAVSELIALGLIEPV
jgi:hypothetical protein